MNKSWVFQINLSDGGAPKTPVHSAAVEADHIVGDRQNDLKHHGGPERALCLFSLEVIKELQQEGHPIYPGATGENLTITGLEWQALEPGVRIAVGDTVQIEITRHTTPCKKIASSFLDQQFDRILFTKHAGWSRLYAKVITTGHIQVGDTVRIIE